MSSSICIHMYTYSYTHISICHSANPPAEKLTDKMKNDVRRNCFFLVCFVTARSNGNAVVSYARIQPLKVWIVVYASHECCVHIFWRMYVYGQKVDYDTSKLIAFKGCHIIQEKYVCLFGIIVALFISNTFTQCFGI